MQSQSCQGPDQGPYRGPSARQLIGRRRFLGFFVAVLGGAALVACGGAATVTPAPASATSPAPAAATVAVATAAPSTAAPTVATTAPSTAAAAPSSSASAAATSVRKVNANTATVAELRAAFEVAGITNAAKWAREVEEYRPYPTNDPTFAKLRAELAKYNPGPGVVDQIIAVLVLQ